MSEIPYRRELFITVSILCLIIVSVYVATVFDIPLGSESDEDKNKLRCLVADKHSQYMKNEWLLSDNISSYEDIPATERENLSKESKDWLNVSHPGEVREYNPTLYEELPKNQKRLFNTALNNSTTFNESSLWLYGSYSPYVLHEGRMYRCDVLRPPAE